MRILIITGIFLPDIGGPATYVPQVARGLVDRGHQITVFTLSDRMDHDDREYPFQVIRLPRQVCRPWRWSRTVTQIIRLGRKADVLFVNGLAAEAVLANLWLRKPMVQKVVGDLAWEWVTNRGWVKDSFEDFQKKRYHFRVNVLKAIRAWWVRQADKVIVPSHYLARWVVGWGVPEQKLVVIYNALEPLNGISPIKVPLPVSINIVTVGRLVSWKRVHEVIKAIRQFDDVGLIVIGDGPERWHLEELARALGIVDRVYFAGQRSKAETLDLMAACDFFVLNSTYEGLPHVVLEAMGLGLPVVATAVGGTLEIVKDGENGLLVPPTDNGALSGALLKLVSSPLERQHLSKGAKHTVERFNFWRMVEETASVLQRALNQEK